MGNRTVIADRAFAERVLERVAAAECERHRHERLRLFVPIGVIVVVGVTWAIALLDGVVALRLVIEVIAWVSAVGALEQRLSAALLGSFAPLPLIVSLLLFVAALGWVRVHQPDPPEVPW
jgi:hypothetical protein